MSISPTTLSALQNAGQAVYDVHAEVTSATRAQALRVSETLEMNPFALESDSLFNNWKSMARLAQELQNIESQLRALYTTACALNTEDDISVTDKPALPSPTLHGQRVTKRVAQKSAKPSAKPAGKASAKAAASPVAKAASKRAAKSAAPAVSTATAETAPQGTALKGNNAKVMACLAGILNAQDFTLITQSSIAESAGIPKGSINLAIRQLVSLRQIEEGPKGHYKLV